MWCRTHASFILLLAADDKPGRDAAVAKLIRKSLARLGLSYPDAEETKGIVIPD